MAQKEPAEGGRVPNAVGAAPKRLRGTGISAVLPAGLQSPARSRDAGMEPCPSLASSSLPAHTLRTAPGEPAGHRRWFILGINPPLLRVSPGLRRCPPGRAPSLSPAGFPSSPRVAGDSSAYPRGSPLRSAGRRGLGSGRAAVDRLKASISQPLLNPSSRDGSGHPQRVKVKAFVTAERREKKRGEEGVGKRGLMLRSIDARWGGGEITWRSSCKRS